MGTTQRQRLQKESNEKEINHENEKTKNKIIYLRRESNKIK